MSNLSTDMEKFLRVFMESDAGVPWRDITVVTALGPEQPAGANRKYSVDQMVRARKALKHVLSTIDRHATVVPMGPETTKIVTGRYGRGNTLEDLRGYVLPHWELKYSAGREKRQVGEYKTSNMARGYTKGDPKFGWVAVQVPPPMGEGWEGLVIPTYAPNYMQEMGLKPMFAWVQDLRRAAELPKPIDLTGTVGMDGFPPYNSIGDVAALLGSDEPVAFDIETVGYTDVIERIAFSDGEHTVSLPWGKEGRDISLAILSKPGRLKVAHNIMFDAARLKMDGVEVVGPWWDTMLAAHLLQPELPKGLGRVASLYLNLGVPWKGTAEQFPIAYNAKDAWATALIQEEQAHYMRQTGMMPLFVGDIMPSVPVLMDMQKGGLRVDVGFQALWTQDLLKRQIAAVEALARIAPGVDVTSTKKLARYLYGELRLPAHYNKDDGWTTDSAALHDLIRTNPEKEELLRLLLELREVNKLLDTFAGVETDHEHKVHPGYLPRQKDERNPAEGKRKGGASTGRLGCSDPNIQQQPKEARRLYVPDTYNDVFISADWNQAELRVLAALSGDKALTKALEGDVHTHTMQVMGVSRLVAKTTTYLTCYGGGPRKLRETLLEAGLDLSEADCRQFQDGWAKTYPMAWSYLLRLAQSGKRDGYLTDPFKRRRYFYGGGRDTPEMKDFMPQATVAGMMWASFVELHAGFKALGGRLVSNIHDEFLGQVPQDRARDGAVLLEKVLGREFPNVAPGFRVPLSVKIGRNWRDMQPYGDHALHNV